jgi:hypothetical protein
MMKTRLRTGIILERNGKRCLNRFKGFGSLLNGDVIELDKDNHFHKKSRWKILSDVYQNEYGILQALMEPYPRLTILNEKEEFIEPIQSGYQPTDCILNPAPPPKNP